ncbi:MAG: radical SAM protein [Methanosarcinales archaeon]|nr:radical SAM protein [Methanosarcinales archaeon]
MNKYLTVKRIEFAVTYLCNARCRHCYSIHSEGAFPAHIDKSLALEIVRKVGRKYKLESIMTFGGEPLLFPEIVCVIHKEAASVGIPLREVITNGYWSNNSGRIKEIAKNLAESGVNSIIISVDAFHQEHVPLDIIRKTAEACLQARIEDVSWDPCWVISEDDDNRYNRKTKFILKELEDLPIRNSGGNMMEPEGLALVNLKEFLPPRKKIPAGKCGDIPYTEPLDSIKCVCVEPDGRIAVCNDFYIGNASKTDIVDLIESYDPFKIPEMKAIIENGMKGLIDWARTKGVEPDPEGYYSICQMCTNIRKSKQKLK